MFSPFHKPFYSLSPDPVIFFLKILFFVVFLFDDQYPLSHASHYPEILLFPPANRSRFSLSIFGRHFPYLLPHKGAESLPHLLAAFRLSVNTSLLRVSRSFLPSPPSIVTTRPYSYLGILSTTAHFAVLTVCNESSFPGLDLQSLAPLPTFVPKSRPPFVFGFHSSRARWYLRQTAFADLPPID